MSQVTILWTLAGSPDKIGYLDVQTLQIILRGQLPAVQISTEKRQGNKRVTKVAGLELFLVDVQEAGVVHAPVHDARTSCTVVLVV